MLNDGFKPFMGTSRYLTLREWTALRKSFVQRAHEERRRVIRQMFRGAILRIWESIQARRRAREELSSMTDQELRDIGIARSGIEAAIRQDEENVSVSPGSRTWPDIYKDIVA
jgi:uncharacterized protein YjiS (DUF1127 family)